MEAVAGAIMSALIPKLNEMLKDEYNLDMHVRKGAKSLMMMHAALCKVAEVPWDQLGEQVQIWAVEVRELSYDIGNHVNDFMLRMLENQDSEHGNMGRVVKFLNMIKGLFIKGKDLHQISKAIKEAQDLAMELTEQRQRYELDMPRTGSVASINPRMVAMHEDVVELVSMTA